MLKQVNTGLEYINELLSVTFEVTYACDKSCSYCYNPLPRRSGLKSNAKELIMEELFNIEKPLQVLILGGESTLFKPSIDFFNKFSSVYEGNCEKHITYFTHGNNENRVYRSFVGGNKYATVSMSFHLGQTDEKLWFENIKILRDNNVNVVVCFLIQWDISSWGYCKEILTTAAAMGCDTDVSIEIDKDSGDVNKIDGYLDVFGMFKYKCFKIKDISIVSGDKELVKFCRNEYYDYFPMGMSNIKKMCKNRVFTINPYGIISRECGVGDGIDISESPERMHEFMNKDNVICESVCTGLASTLNQKMFLNAKNLKDIQNA